MLSELRIGYLSGCIAELSGQCGDAAGRQGNGEPGQKGHLQEPDVVCAAGQQQAVSANNRAGAEDQAVESAEYDPGDPGPCGSEHGKAQGNRRKWICRSGRADQPKDAGKIRQEEKAWSS